MKKVALKFCGGCDPAYDRVEFFARVRSAAGNRIEWVQIGEHDFVAVLLIAGCPRACPEKELKYIQSTRIIAVKNTGFDPDQLVDKLLLE